MVNPKTKSVEGLPALLFTFSRPINKHFILKILPYWNKKLKLPFDSLKIKSLATIIFLEIQILLWPIQYLGLEHHTNMLSAPFFLYFFTLKAMSHPIGVHFKFLTYSLSPPYKVWVEESSPNMKIKLYFTLKHVPKQVWKLWVKNSLNSQGWDPEGDSIIGTLYKYKWKCKHDYFYQNLSLFSQKLF